MYRITAAVLLSPSSVDVVLACVLRTSLLPLSCCGAVGALSCCGESLWLEGSAGSALQVVLHKVVSPPDSTPLPRGMFVMAPSKPYQIESLSQPQFPALMSRTDLLLPVL